MTISSSNDKDFLSYIVDKENIKIKKIKMELKIENQNKYLIAIKGLRKCLKK